MKIDDVSFIRELFISLSKEYSLKRKRAFATGMSNGGDMSYLLACTSADLFRAVAPVAGSLMNKIKDFEDDDLININDIDEIPNFDKFIYKKKITIFKQKMIYYKFNLVHPKLTWMGSKICKKKHLHSPQWIRKIK